MIKVGMTVACAWVANQAEPFDLPSLFCYFLGQCQKVERKTKRKYVNPFECSQKQQFKTF